MDIKELFENIPFKRVNGYYQPIIMVDKKTNLVIEITGISLYSGLYGINTPSRISGDIIYTFKSIKDKLLCSMFFNKNQIIFTKKDKFSKIIIEETIKNNDIINHIEDYNERLFNKRQF